MLPRIFATLCLILSLVFVLMPAHAQQTQLQYLSGHDKDDAVSWDFFCDAGKIANQWTTIPVPSNWELHGFGDFTYGTDLYKKPPPTVEGRYRHRFSVPAAWATKRVFLVFEGVMTDTQAQVNGQSAGPAHQGGYFQFQYDVTKLLKYGQQNVLAVTVHDESSEPSINMAERRGDYWNYAGIYRPVYLEAVPSEFIDRVAVNAQDDGHFAVDVYGGGIARPDTVEAQILDLQGRLVGPAFSQPITPSTPTVRLQTQIASPRLWTAETPNLYQVEVRLMHGGTVLHVIRQRFGFRTIELRPGEGIFVNGKRVLLKGCCRHSFWPDSGRCLSEKINREDILLMKGMNMNAVRMSHYPPDRSFLDDCDTLGLYVLDELPGWQHKYDTAVGHRLVREMVVRDVNHPSILFWDNGNEGGWNTALDDDYALWDPQGRHVIHPGGGSFRDDLDIHYPNYARLQAMAAGNEVFLPTEFLHGLYAGGAGSGLADYWDVIRHSKVAGGGFIWAFLDEAVRRVDLQGQLDTHGNAAPDGIVGPYREKEGSYDTIKQVWSPLVIPENRLPPNFAGRLTLENRYDFTDARQCRFTWQLRRFRRPNETGSGFSVFASGTAAPTTAIPPGTTGTLSLNLPPNWRQAEALSVRADDPQGHEVWTWVWPLPHSDDFRTITTLPAREHMSLSETASQIRVQCGTLTVEFSKQTGLLTAVQRAGQLFSLVNGPRPLVGQATLTAITYQREGSDEVIKATYAGAMNAVRWRVRSNGWVQCDYTYSATGPQDFLGVGFDYPEADMQAKRWFGDGPNRVWQNRTAGPTLGVWANAYNNTVTGSELWQYPAFKGYFGGVRWIQFQTTQGPITAVINQGTPYVQVLTPKFPPPALAGHTIPPFPDAGISFLDAIPPMGSKFAAADIEGPSGQKTVAFGDYHGSVSFYFGKLPD